MNTFQFAIKITGYFLLAAIPSSCASMMAEREKQGPPETVDKVDLKRYAGRWFEIAKIPNRFQKKCARDTTADYTIRQDGQIDVLNRCVRKDGKPIEAKGIARIMDSTSYAKLKVSFFRLLGFRLFWGDYWIIGLDEEYQYAIVGTPTRRYGWVLARETRLSDSQLEAVFSRLRSQGYEPKDFEMTSHSARPPN